MLRRRFRGRAGQVHWRLIGSRGRIGRQRRQTVRRRVVPRIEQTLRVSRRRWRKRSSRVSESAIETFDCRIGRHGRQRSAPVVGGAFIVAACLLETGGEPKYLRVARKACKSLAQPGFSLRHVCGAKGR